MPLEVWIGKKSYLAETQAEMLALVDKIFDEVGNEEYEVIDGRRYYTANQVATLSRSDDYLRVSMIKHTGFGALIWWVLRSSPRSGGIYEHTWVSDNPDTPNNDLRLVADPYVPEFHDPRNALPLKEIRNALEEYCRTGDRPESISWAKGKTNGRRPDSGPRPAEIDPL